MVKKTYTITSILPQRRSKKRLSIFLDEEYWLSLDKELVYLLNLYEGKKVTPKELEKIIFEEERKKALDKALRLLSYRARSVFEVEKALKIDGYHEKIIKSVVGYLKKIGYLDNKDFAKMWAKEKIERLYGPLFIKSELFEKGIEKELTEETLKSLYPKELEYELALKLAEKKVKATSSGKINYSRLFRYLTGRGFHSDISAEVCREVLQKFRFLDES